jgi:hypothetical protein
MGLHRDLEHKETYLERPPHLQVDVSRVPKVDVECVGAIPVVFTPSACKTFRTIRTNEKCIWAPFIPYEGIQVGIRARFGKAFS